jgi:hypothetical protein
MGKHGHSHCYCPHCDTKIDSLDHKSTPD